jgi:hypothetical protein
MQNIVIIGQVVIALGIANVWLVRSGKVTAYRGGEARTMQEEFAVYGLPPWSVWSIGALKLALAAALVVGIWIPELVRPAAIGMAVLMLGAVAMHVKVRDPLLKALPAAGMLALSVFVAVFG